MLWLPLRNCLRQPFHGEGRQKAVEKSRVLGVGCTIGQSHGPLYNEVTLCACVLWIGLFILICYIVAFAVVNPLYIFVTRQDFMMLFFKMHHVE